jgi:hypothetical protein
VSLYFLFLANAVYATVNTIGLLFWDGHLSAAYIVWFDSTRTLLYYIDLYAIYLLFSLNPNGFKLLVATSTVYALGEMGMGYMTISGLSKGTKYFVLLYAITGIIFPYIDVLLVYSLAGKKFKLRCAKSKIYATSENAYSP